MNFLFGSEYRNDWLRKLKKRIGRASTISLFVNVNLWKIRNTLLLYWIVFPDVWINVILKYVQIEMALSDKTGRALWRAHLAAGCELAIRALAQLSQPVPQRHLLRMADLRRIWHTITGDNLDPFLMINHQTSRTLKGNSMHIFTYLFLVRMYNWFFFTLNLD